MKPKQPMKNDPSSSRGRGKSRGVTQQKIVDIASDIIGREGLDNFRLNDVAAALDVKPSAIYNHFANREAVIVAVSEMISRDMVAAAHAPYEGTAAEKIEHFAKGLTRYLFEHPAAARLQLVDIASRSFFDLGGVAEIDKSAQRALSQILDQGVKEGAFRKVRLEAFRAFVIAGVSANVIWHLYVQTKKPPSLSVLQREASDLALKYVQAD